MKRQMTISEMRKLRAPAGSGCLELCEREECRVLDSFTAPCPLYQGIKAPACKMQHTLRLLLTRRELRERGLL